jgi:hypothetical protein
MSFKTVAKLKYSGMTVTNKKYINEEIKGRLNLRMLATTQPRIFYSFMLAF